MAKTSRLPRKGTTRRAALKRKADAIDQLAAITIFSQNPQIAEALGLNHQANRQTVHELRARVSTRLRPVARFGKITSLSQPVDY